MPLPQYQWKHAACNLCTVTALGMFLIFVSDGNCAPRPEAAQYPYGRSRPCRSSRLWPLQTVSNKPEGKFNIHLI